MLIVLGWFLFTVVEVQAVDFQGKDKVTIDATVDEDLYVAAGTITVNASIQGDLVCAGGTITINDTIAEDLMIGAGTVIMAGHIGDDVRMAGGTMTIQGEVIGDMVVAGGQLRLEEGSTIHGDLRVYGGRLVVHGNVKGNANVWAGEVDWQGRAENTLNIKTEDLVFNGTALGPSSLAAKDIILGENARLEAPVKYCTEKGEVEFAGKLASGVSVTYDEGLQIATNQFNWKHLGIGVVGFWIYRLIAGALIIGLLVLVFDRFFRLVSEKTNRAYINQLGYGFLYLIGVPIVIFLACVTIIGIPIGLSLAMLYGFSLALGHLVAAVFIAYAIDTYYDKQWMRKQLFLTAVGIFLVLKIISLIPFAGWLISLIIVSLAFGSILHVWWDRRRLGTTL